MIDIAAPNKLWISLTNKCNLRCLHCLPDSHTSMVNELSKEEILGLIENAKELGVRRIAFTGGEPTLHPDLLDFVAAASGDQRRVYVESNGAKLSVDRLSALQASGLNILNLSLDGGSPESNDSFRGAKGLFDKVLSTVVSACDLGLDVRVYCVVGQYNISDALHLIDIMQNLKVRLGVLTFSCFTPIGRGLKNNHLALPPLRWREFCKEVEARRQDFERRVGPLRYHTTFLTEPEFEQYSDSLTYDFKCIARGRDYIYVSPIGDAFGCAVAAGTSASLGNIRLRPLGEIWYTSKNWNFFKEAEACGGCPALALASGQDEDPRAAEAKRGDLRPICPMTQYPQIEAWEYQREGEPSI